MTETRKVSELKQNPLSLAIYGTDEDVSDLIESIGQHGLLSPIVIRPDGVILSGHRRFAAVTALGLEKVECVIHTPKDEAEEEVFIIEANRARQKSMIQLRREGERLKELLAKPALQARLQYINGGSRYNGGETLSVKPDSGFSGAPAEKFDTRAEIAKQLGISKTRWEQIEYVNKYVEIGNPVALEASRLLNSNKISVNKAHDMVRKEVKALEAAESGEAAPEGAEHEQTPHEFNLVCKAQVADHLRAVCDILDKVEGLPDSDFIITPWRALAAEARLLNKKLAAMDERILKRRRKMFENVNLKEAVCDGENQ